MKCEENSLKQKAKNNILFKKINTSKLYCRRTSFEGETSTTSAAAKPLSTFLGDLPKF